MTRSKRKYGSRLDVALLTRARRTLGLSQAQMGEALSLTQGAVSHVEMGIRSLSPLARRELRRLLARHRAERYISELLSASGAVVRRQTQCHGARLPVSEHFAHAETCAKCLTRRYLQP